MHSGLLKCGTNGIQFGCLGQSRREQSTFFSLASDYDVSLSLCTAKKNQNPSAHLDQNFMCNMLKKVLILVKMSRFQDDNLAKNELVDQKPTCFDKMTRNSQLNMTKIWPKVNKIRSVWEELHKNSQFEAKHNKKLTTSYKDSLKILKKKVILDQTKTTIR